MKKNAKKIVLPSGRIIPAIGLGMWYFGKDAGSYFKELALLRQALEIGYRVFDVAESYAEGAAEEVLGEAISDCRRSVFLTSKVTPDLMSYENIIESCHKSLERLKTDYLDMYLLHWKTYKGHLEEVVEAFQDLKNEGSIRDFGVSHFDKHELEEWLSIKGAEETNLNQANFSLAHCFASKELLPFCQQKRIPLIAYAPCDILPSSRGYVALKKVAEQNDIYPCQVNLAWLFAQTGVGVLVKSEEPEALKVLFKAQEIGLTTKDVKELEEAFLIKERL